MDCFVPLTPNPYPHRTSSRRQSVPVLCAVYRVHAARQGRGTAPQDLEPSVPACYMQLIRGSRWNPKEGRKVSSHLCPFLNLDISNKTEPCDLRRRHHHNSELTNCVPHCALYELAILQPVRPSSFLPLHPSLISETGAQQ